MLGSQSGFGVGGLFFYGLGSLFYFLCILIELGMHSHAGAWERERRSMGTINLGLGTQSGLPVALLELENRGIQQEAKRFFTLTMRNIS